MNSIEALTSFFGWCAVINIGLLMLSGIMLIAMRGRTAKIHAAMFDVPEQDLNNLYLKFLAYYKVATLVFFVTPWIALKMMA